MRGMAVVAGVVVVVLALLACKGPAVHDADVLVDVPPDVSALSDELLTSLGIFTKIGDDIELIGILCESESDVIRFSNARKSDEKCVEPVAVTAFAIPGIAGDTEDTDTYNDNLPCGAIDPPSPREVDLEGAVALAEGQLFAGLDDKAACESSSEALALTLERVE